MNEETLFAEALQRQDPGQRQAFLDMACGGDAALRQRIEALLQCHQRGEDFLQEPAFRLLPTEKAEAQVPDLDAVGTATKRAPADEPHANILRLLEPAQRPGALGRIRHYEVLEVVGQGGFGTVLKVFDDRLHRVVALKVLATEVAANGTARQRFLREARAAAAVRHENVIDIHVVDEEPIPHLVMEYIDGPTLQEKLDRRGQLPVNEILRIGMQIAEGLAAAHKQGLIHRDIKPSNILLENGVERVKISDFGLARAVDDASLTQSGLVAGTPLFMSPEQAEGQPLDQRSDLFSLGSVLYALCTGHAPFRASSSLAVLRRVSEDTPRPIRECNGDIPEWLCAIIARLHAKNPAERFQSARAVADLLATYLARIQQKGSLDISDSTTSQEKATGQRPQAKRTIRPRILAALLLGIAIAGVGYLALHLWSEQALKIKPPFSSWTGTNDSLPAPIDAFAGRQRQEVPAALLALAGNGDATQAPAELVAVLAGPTVGHVGEIHAVAISRDGRALASGGQDKTVKVWDLAGWKKGEPAPPVRTLSAHADGVRSVAFSPDGKRLASASTDGSVVLWDAATGQEIRTFTGGSRRVPAAVFSADGRLLAAVSRDNNTAKLWDMESLRPKEPLTLSGGQVLALAFHPGGRLLAFGEEDNKVGLCEVAADRLQQVFATKGKVLGTAFSQDGSTLAAVTDAPDSALYCWDMATRKQTAVLRGQTGAVAGLAMQPGGRLLATGDRNGNVRFWRLPGDGDTGTPLSVNVACPGGALHVEFTPDGRYLAVAGGNGIIAILRSPDVPARYSPGPPLAPPSLAELAARPSAADALKPDAIPSLLLQEIRDPARAPAGLVAILADDRFLLPRGDGGIMRMDRSPDGKFLAIPRGNDLIVFETPSGKHLRTLQGPGGHMRRVTFSPDSQLLAATAWDGDSLNLVRVWDVANGWKVLDREPLPPLNLDYLTFSGNSKHLVASGNKGQPLFVADARTGKKVQVIDNGPEFHAILGRAGKYLAAADWNSTKVILWDTGTWQEYKTFERSRALVGDPALSPDGKLLAMGSDSEVKLCRVDSGEVLHTFQTPGHALTFTPDSKTLLTWATVEARANHTVTRWDVAEGKELGQFSVTGPVDLFYPCLSQDGKDLYLAYPQSRLLRIRVFDAATGKERPCQGHSGQVAAVAVSPNGKLAASGGADGTVRLWDLASGQMRHVLTGHQDMVWTVAFSPDSKVVASGGADRKIRLWDAERGQEIHVLTGHASVVRQVAFAPDGMTLASAGLEGVAKLWEPRTGTLLRSFPSAGECGCVAFSPNGKTLAAGDKGAIRLLDLDSGWCVATLPGHTASVRSLAFHPDGQALVSSANDADPVVRVWDLATLTEKARLTGHTGEDITALWRPDGKALLSGGGSDGTVRLWDMTVSPPRGRVLQVRPSGTNLGCIAQSPEGRYLATANADGSIFILNLGDPAEQKDR